MSLFVPPAVRATDANNLILPGAKWYFYVTGGTTPAPTYTTSALNVAHANPVVADTAGLFAPIFLDPTIAYRAVLKTSAGIAVPNGDFDPINGDSAADLRFLQSGTGAVARTVQSKLRDVVSVKDFGVLGDGSDETVKIQTALSNTTGRLFFPTGSYGATALTVPPALDIEGDGEGTWFVPLDNVSVYMTLQGGNGVSNFQVVPGSQRTGGTIFKPTGNEVTIRDFKVSNCYKIADISGTVAQCTIDQFNFRDNNNNGASELILVDTSGSGNTITNGISDNNPATQPSSGIRIRSCPDLVLDELDLVDCGTPIKIDPPTDKVVASIKAGILYLDSSSNTSLLLDVSGGGAIVRSTFADIEGSSQTGNGATMVAGASPSATVSLIAGIEIGHLETHLNGADGLHMTGVNYGNVTIAHHSAAGNTVGAALSLGAGTPGPTIIEAQYGNVDGIGAANKYGVFFGAAATVKIRGGLITGNTTANLTGDTSGATILGVSGIVTKNSGSGTLANGGTSIVVSHGLAGTPAASKIKFWPTATQGTTPLFIDTSTISSTQFTVKTASAAAADITFGWEATCLGA